MQAQPTKKCSKCGVEKPLGEFYADKRASDGLSSACQDCTRAAATAWRLAHLEHSRIAAREYARAHRKEAAVRHKRWREKNAAYKREQDRLWREQNPERKAANDRRWAEANPNRTKAARDRWRARHPEQDALIRWRQQLRRRGEDPSLDTLAYRNILKSDPCCYCGAPCKEIDHIEPRDALDVNWNDWSNLTASCQSCNRHKSAKSLLVFLAT